MLKIEITDPHTLDKETLFDLAKMLFRMSGHEIATAEDVTYNIGLTVPASEEIDMSHYEGTPLQPEIIGQDCAFVPEPATSNPFANRVSPAPLPSATPVPPPPPMDSAPVGFKGNSPLEPVNITNGLKLDTQGYPWDRRIHSRTRTTVADGTWKVQRGMTPEYLKEVRAELMQALHAPAAPTKAQPITVTHVDQPDYVPVTPGVDDPIDESLSLDFPKLMTKITGMLTTKKITHAQVTHEVNALGIQHLPLIAVRPDLIPTLFNNLDKYI